MATCLSRRNGILECWNAGILGIKAEDKPFKLKKLLSFSFIQDKLTQHSITPLFLPSETFFYFTRAIIPSGAKASMGRRPIGAFAPKFPFGVPVAAGQGLSWQKVFYSSTGY